MRVKILVEFEVETDVDDDELDEGTARAAASLTAWHNLVLTETGTTVRETVDQFVDGFGVCSVRVGEDHE